MLRLIDEENPESGFRLTALELFNWGTFDRKIWRLCPNGRNSLLTGGNGSGKTTVVDAIITLLVPAVRRHYNQSSGADRKRERSEGSYVLGAHKTVQEEGELTPKIRYLRTRDDLSILLGVFTNADMGETLTLAQVRWHANNDLKKVFLVAPAALTIREHFYPIGHDGQWRIRLKEKYRAEFFDHFQPYSHRFSKTFGIKSEKALSLFSQTVGIKVIGNLNEFIRTHMLEESNMEDAFRRLKDNYTNLLSSHTAIEKAKTQLELLAPIMESGAQFETLSESARDHEMAGAAVAPVFADLESQLLSLAMARAVHERDNLSGQLTSLQTNLEALNRQRDDLKIAISRDAVSEELRNIDRDIGLLTRERDAAKERMGQYNEIARALGCQADPDEAVFSETRQGIASKRQRLVADVEALSDEWRGLESESANLTREYEALTAELFSLRQRQGNIPLKHLELRKRLVDHLGLTETALPFIGELVRVKATEGDWEAAIEKMLHALALHLLVPEAQLPRVNEFVSGEDLKARIGYYGVTDKIRPDLMSRITPESLLEKLEIKADAPHREWLHAHIRKQWRAICTGSLTDLARLDYALTPEGLQKALDRHEKDDRPTRSNRENYVLGWDNKEKIRYLEAHARELAARLKETRTLIDQARRRLSEKEKIRELLIKLDGFDRFDAMNWRKPAANIESLKLRKKELLESSDRLLALEKQLALIEREILAQREQTALLTRRQWETDETLKQYQGRLAENRRVLTDIGADKLEEMNKVLSSRIESAAGSITLETLPGIKKAIVSDIDRERGQIAAESMKIEKTLLKQMAAYTFGTEAIRERYPEWTSETTNLMQDTAYLKEYRTIYHRIHTEDMPRYKDRFKKYLNEQVVLDIANFKTVLDTAADDIRQNIREINLSLKEIDYNSQPATYIRLIERDEKDIRIRDFRQKLREAMPDAVKLIQGDEQELEYAFKRIRDLIEEMAGNMEWRRYVTDVRNWLRFAAEEKYRADEVQKQYYEDSQSLSGGEKAKLAYTILASAIAYQFGIQQKKFHLKSFRFVVVDEAFSKVDPENSIYAMELFKKLNLQLMLVTPLDKINLAEKYIHAVHYVENKHQRDSAVYDLTLAEYRERKAAFRQEASVAEDEP